MRAALVAAVVGLAASASGAGCARGGRGGEGELLRALGDDVDLVVLAAPRRAAGTWVDRLATQLAADVPACVRERARRADAAAVTWDQQAAAWSLVLIGGGATAAGCAELARDGALAWYGADPRRGDRRFFAADERKRRWRALGTAPLRALGDVELSPGIVAHAAATLDPGDGVDAAATLRFGERAAADGLVQRLARWRERLDRQRLGGAWPALAVELTRDPADPRGATLRGALRLAGAAGEEAVIFAVTAWRGGELDPAGAPCPPIGDQWAAQVRCDRGRFVVAPALRDRLAADPTLLVTDARVVPAIKDGASAGFKLYAIRPSSLAAALGFQNGDRVHAIAGAATPTPAEVLPALRGLGGATDFTIELERRGQALALRYQVR